MSKLCLNIQTLYEWGKHRVNILLFLFQMISLDFIKCSVKGALSKHFEEIGGNAMKMLNPNAVTKKHLYRGAFLMLIF